MNKIIIFGLISVICFIGITLFSKKHTNKYIVFFWWACFIAAFFLNIGTIYNNYRSSNEINRLNSELGNIKTKELQKNFKPLNNKIKLDVTNSLKVLSSKYPSLKDKFQIMCVNPSKDTYQKALEITELIKNAGISATYTNTILSANANVVLLYPASFSKVSLEELSRILLKIFKLKRISVKQNEKNGFILYVLGSPYFDEQGRVFY